MNPLYHREAAQLQAAVYESDHEDLYARLRLLGFQSRQACILDGGLRDERVLVLQEGNLVYVVFRGTVNGAQWKSNLKVWAAGAVHAGFNEGFKELSGELCRILRGYHEAGYRFVFAGHSRGAALAALAYRQLTAFRVEALHLFGCPRVLKERPLSFMAENRQLPIWRWVANNDVVSRLPFAWMGYVHVGREMYFDARDRLHPGGGFWRRLAGQIGGRLRGGLFDGVSDHNSSREYERLVGKLELDE